MKSAIEIMHRRAEDAVRELVARAPVNSIRAAFAGGSVGRDEVWSAHDGDSLAIYSDIDLYVVLADGADQDRVRRAAQQSMAMLPGAIDGVVFWRGVEVAVYRLDDLLAEPARPGTVDLHQHHRWLYGDRSLVGVLASALHRTIARTEALYLLENRAWDALDALVAGDGAEARARVLAAKVVLDVGAAHLIAEGRFVPTYVGRMNALRQKAPASLAPSVLAAIETAEELRTGSASAQSAGALEARDALALATEAWCALAPSLVLKNAGAPSGGSGEPHAAAAMLATRCARGSSIDNYREFVRLRRRAGWSLAGAFAAGRRFAHLSPLSALRTHAVARGLSETSMAPRAALSFHSVYVDALAAHLGCSEGTLDERAREALRRVG